MPRPSDVEEVLEKADALERQFDCVKALELYQKVLLASEREDFLRLGEINERIGSCFFQSAMQAKNRQEFLERIKRAIQAFEKAHQFYEKLVIENKTARMFRCKSLTSYLRYWLTSNPHEKRKYLHEYLVLIEKALTGFLESREMLEFVRTYNYFPWVLVYVSLWEIEPVKHYWEKGIEWGEKAVEAISEIGNPDELAKTYLTMGICSSNLGSPVLSYIEGITEKDDFLLKAVKYWKKAVEISKRTNDTYTLAYCHLLLHGYTERKQEEEHLEKSMKHSRNIGHVCLTAWNLYVLAYNTHWKAIATEDPTKRREVAGKAMEYYDEAQHYFSIVKTQPPQHRRNLLWSVGYADHFLALALWETNIERRLEFLERAEKECMKDLKSAEDTDGPVAIATSLHTMIKILEARAISITDSVEKRDLLAKALIYHEMAFKIAQQHAPYAYWQLGVMQNHLAEIKMKLSDLEPDSNKKLRLLEEAMSSWEKCLSLCNLMRSPRVGDIRYYSSIQKYQDSFAKLLMQIYDLTNNQEHLEKAIEISQKAIESAANLGLFSLRAESYWRMAKAQDILSERIKAAESFEHASESYELAANRIPQLRSFYSDYASYMKAWAEIERSRHEHENEDYARSQEHYRDCSRHLEATKKWSYLSSYYNAWSLLESGEELSRLDKPQEAIEAFDDAKQMFGDSTNSLRLEAKELESSEDRDEASKLAVTAQKRLQYCTGRALMEKAKIFSRKGDRISSAANYSDAANIFERIVLNLAKEEARSELKFAYTVCRAWENMELAEERRDISLYRKAAELFSEAGEISRNKTGRMMALGNSCFCEALELGLKFMSTSDIELYSQSKMRMQDASRYYISAGFEKYACWVDATKRLFDAYVYASRAEAEFEPEKRARLYLLAEKCLELSTDLYEKGGYHDKKDEALRSLERMKKEREMALSLREVLAAPTSLSGIGGFSMPDSTELAVGLSDFESVNIKTRFSVPKDYVPGEEFQLKLDLVNVGKKPGLLVRIEDFIPQKCEVSKVPSYCSLKGRSLDLKGRSLNHLSLESIDISVKVGEVAYLRTSPKVIYVDETGKFKTIQIESAEILPVIRFESEVSRTVLDFLVNAFVEDYVKRKMLLANSGWRTRMKIISSCNISKYSIYGDGIRPGKAMSELERQKIIETRIFPGERGRGGRVLKTRILHENQKVKQYIDRQIIHIQTARKNTMVISG